MKKRKVDALVLPGQLPLNFDVFAVEAPTALLSAGGDNALDGGIRQVVNGVLERCLDKGLSRERVADRLTESLSRPVAKAQLDQWAAPSQADRRILVDVWMALMQIAQDFAPLDWMALHFERRVLTADEAVLAEFGAMAVLDRHIRSKQRTIEGLMDEKLLSQIMARIQKKSAR
ncbi:hypothetical protein [Burkholderia vietnamiensis]|uniref:hypothetical protein n=1 Tax=Burkholderia vietnamiensis TaxID=60552 RepID=UPI00158E9997|nr:hypothetical protein [Burkholderia vietnamiensis]